MNWCIDSKDYLPWLKAPAFATYLISRGDNDSVGRARSLDDCPLAIFAKEIHGIDVSMSGRSAYMANMDTGEIGAYPLPKWAIRFVDACDALPDNHITRGKAAAILAGITGA